MDTPLIYTVARAFWRAVSMTSAAGVQPPQVLLLATPRFPLISTSGFGVRVRMGVKRCRKKTPLCT